MLHPALPINFTVSWKGLPRTNTPAYLAHSLVKSFVNRASWTYTLKDSMSLAEVNKLVSNFIHNIAGAGYLTTHFYSIMILGSIINIHFKGTLSTFIFKIKYFHFDFLDALSVIKLKVPCTSLLIKTLSLSKLKPSSLGLLITNLI
jgi:hypothetical protein